MPKITLSSDVIDKNSITIGDCTHPAGHCFGSDGGSGIPENLRVASGAGGEKEVWTLSADKMTVLAKDIYLVCQYCGKYTYGESEENRAKNI